MAIHRRPSNDNPWAECGKDALPQGGCVCADVQPLGTPRSRASHKEPWHDHRTQHNSSWPCLQNNVLFQNVKAPLGSGSPLPKSKAWKTILCPWTDDQTRKQMSLCTTEADSALKWCPKRCIPHKIHCIQRRFMESTEFNWDTLY